MNFKLRLLFSGFSAYSVFYLGIFFCHFRNALWAIKKINGPPNEEVNCG